MGADIHPCEPAMSFDKTTPGLRPMKSRSHLAGVIALFALAVTVAVWVWTRHLAVVSVPLFGWQNGVIVGGAGVFCAGLLAELRAVGFDDLLEWIWAVIAALGAFAVALFWGLLALFGWE
jgi:hypothetical protein